MDKLREFVTYRQQYRAAALQLADGTIARRWWQAGVPADTAAAWANLGYLPEEAQPLINAGITPDMQSIGDQARDAALADLSDDEVRALADRLDAQGVHITPDMRRQLGLD